MGIFDSVKGMFGGVDHEYDDVDDEIIVKKEYSRPAPMAAPSDKQSGEVVNISATTKLEVRVARPESFDEVSDVADDLNNKIIVVLNLECTPKDVSKRLLDFLSGVAYANNGKIQKIATHTFLITPHNVGLEGEILGELENSGFSF